MLATQFLSGVKISFGTIDANDLLITVIVNEGFVKKSMSRELGVKSAAKRSRFSSPEQTIGSALSQRVRLSRQHGPLFLLSSAPSTRFARAEMTDGVGEQRLEPRSSPGAEQIDKKDQFQRLNYALAMREIRAWTVVSTRT
jgi:hypothetical protein